MRKGSRPPLLLLGTPLLLGTALLLPLGSPTAALLLLRTLGTSLLLGLGTRPALLSLLLGTAAALLGLALLLLLGIRAAAPLLLLRLPLPAVPAIAGLLAPLATAFATTLAAGLLGLGGAFFLVPAFLALAFLLGGLLGLGHAPLHLGAHATVLDDVRKEIPQRVPQSTEESGLAHASARGRAGQGFGVRLAPGTTLRLVLDDAEAAALGLVACTAESFLEIVIGEIGHRLCNRTI